MLAEGVFRKGNQDTVNLKKTQRLTHLCHEQGVGAERSDGSEHKWTVGRQAWNNRAL